MKHDGSESEAYWKTLGLAVGTVPDYEVPGPAGVALKMLLVLLHSTLFLGRSSQLSCSSDCDWEILAPGFPAIEPQKEAGRQEGEEKSIQYTEPILFAQATCSLNVAEAKLHQGSLSYYADHQN